MSHITPLWKLLKYFFFLLTTDRKVQNYIADLRSWSFEHSSFPLKVYKKCKESFKRCGKVGEVRLFSLLSHLRFLLLGVYPTTYTTEPWNTSGEVHTPLQEPGFRFQEWKENLCHKLFTDSPQNFRTTTVLVACLKKPIKLKTNFSRTFFPYFLYSLCLRNYKAHVKFF